ncbi:hypothetical protein LCGC14_1254770 [marine sediment metagenome]|uniref:Uncharacterized protein n=1 Tax=marine sediment metagenome TaxID=412755 RepID=A0A0F9LNP1_9ZZZZ
MKAWSKRMIWFFGFSIFSMIDDYFYFLSHGTPFEYEISTAIITLLIIVLPLFFMGDDK